MKKVQVLIAQSCWTLCDPMDCSPPGSSVHRILQARILEWVAIPFPRGSSWPRDWPPVFCIAGRNPQVAIGVLSQPCRTAEQADSGFLLWECCWQVWFPSTGSPHHLEPGVKSAPLLSPGFSSRLLTPFLQGWMLSECRHVQAMTTMSGLPPASQRLYHVTRL